MIAFAKARCGLNVGDIIEIKYRIWREVVGAEAQLADKWISGEVTCVEVGVWPLVRLADGQVTELRPFMTWRLLHSAPGSSMAA